MGRKPSWPLASVSSLALQQPYIYELLYFTLHHLYKEIELLRIDDECIWRQMEEVAIGHYHLPLAGASQQCHSSKILSFSLNHLHKEQELLHMNGECIQRQMQEGAIDNFRAFTTTSNALLNPQVAHRLQQAF